MAFLKNIPQNWISRIHAKSGTLGWAPFRGQLSHQSQRQTVMIVVSMFTWLQSAQYISANPWVLMNQNTEDDPYTKMLDTKALSVVAINQIVTYICRQPPYPSQSRILFILKFS